LGKLRKTIKEYEIKEDCACVAAVWGDIDPLKIHELCRARDFYHFKLDTRLMHFPALCFSEVELLVLLNVLFDLLLFSMPSGFHPNNSEKSGGYSFKGSFAP